eukprot:2989439-Rhodomonas_salina.1
MLRKSRQPAARRMAGRQMMLSAGSACHGRAETCAPRLSVASKTICNAAVTTAALTKTRTIVFWKLSDVAAAE